MKLADWEIKNAVESGRLGISDFSPQHDESLGPSSGLSPHGYDARLAHDYILRSAEADLERTAIDGKIVVGPQEFILARTIESFYLWADMTAEVWSKSTYAREGILIFPTPLEAGWSGTITIEIKNLSQKPYTFYVGAGICQVKFELCERAATPYDLRASGGKYQNQVGPTLPKY